MSNVTAIWAQNERGVIGRNGTIPWYIKKDLEFFKAQTMGAVVIMGRKTWESIPEKFRPLAGRVNIVLTSNFNYVAPGALVVHNSQRAVDIARHNPNVFIIGGDNVYRQFMWYVNKAIVTLVQDETIEAGDAMAPPLSSSEWACVTGTGWMDALNGDFDQSSGGLQFKHRTYERK